MPRTTFKRDPISESFKYSITRETHSDDGTAFADRRDGHDRAAIRYQGEIIAYYGGWNGTYAACEQCARESIRDRIAFACGISVENLPESIRHLRVG